MTKRFNAAAVLAGMGATVSHEDNDLNININADHEGDGEGGGEFDNNPFNNDAPAEVPAATEEVDENLTADTSGAPETAELDLGDDVADIDDTATKIEDTENAVVGIERLMLQAAQISHEGIAVTPVMVSMMQSQLDLATQKFPKLALGGDGNSIVPSFESFSVSLEAEAEGMMSKAGSALKSGGKALVEWLKNLLKKIMALFGSLTAAGQLISRKAASLRASRKPSGKEITLSGALTSAPLTAAEVKRITGLIKSLTADKISVDQLLANGWTKTALSRAQDYSKSTGRYLGNFTVGLVDGVPVLKSAEAGKEKGVKISDADWNALVSANAELGKALVEHKSKEARNKEITNKLIKVMEVEVTPEDAGRYAKWQKAREVSKQWGKYTTFEAKLIKNAVKVGNAVNNALSSASEKK